jgi:hypothetical protein
MLPVKIPKALSIATAQALTEKMESIFKEIEDPRIERNRVHLLIDILIRRSRTRSKSFRRSNTW